MKKITVIILIVNSFFAIAQKENTREFNSSYYTINGGEKILNKNIIQISDFSNITHTNGINNYPIIFEEVRDEGEEYIKVYIYKPNVNPSNYDDFRFKKYGYRAFKEYVEIGIGTILIVEIVQDYYTKTSHTIKYFK